MVVCRVLLLTIASVCAYAAANGRAYAHSAAAATVAVEDLAGKHPSEYYRRAAKLFQEGRKEDAVFAFYLGQLRYRTHLEARPALRPTGDPALFTSLSQVVGRPIRAYAFGDIPALARTLDTVIAYDTQHPDTFTPPALYGTAHSSMHARLAAMKAHMLADAEAIRARRAKNGLENRN